MTWRQTVLGCGIAALAGVATLLAPLSAQAQQSSGTTVTGQSAPGGLTPAQRAIQAFQRGDRLNNENSLSRRRTDDGYGSSKMFEGASKLVDTTNQDSNVGGGGFTSKMP